jgi:hypothetical protein
LGLHLQSEQASKTNSTPTEIDDTACHSLLSGMHRTLDSFDCIYSTDRLGNQQQ